ncbi:MAG: tyrosine phosphatase family protein [Rhizomicrobium sp.]
MILVTPLSAIDDTIRRYRPSHMVTLLSPEHMIETPQGIEPARHLRLSVNDVAESWGAEMPPAAHHVEQLLRFGRDWQASSPILVHCWAGISRSTAAAFILLCDRLGPGSEHMIAQALRARAPHAFPNPLLVSLADEALAREGRMVEAVRGIGRGEIVAEGTIVELPLALADL